MPKQEPNLDTTELSNEALFGLWVEQQLSETQRHEFERRCLADSAFAKRVDAFNMFSMQAEHYQAQDVPNWDRASTFDAPEKRKWWQWQGLPSLSLATSIFAIVMVVTGLQVRVVAGTMTISFASQPSTQEIDRLVDARLNEFQQAQQLVLTDYTQTLQQQQLDNSAQLTQYLLGASRQERREDFAELIKYVNEQRGDDQLFYARQLNKLQQDIFAQPSLSSAGTINE